MKEELKYVLMEYGVLSVMIVGALLMLLLYANNWDILMLDVRCHSDIKIIEFYNY